MARRPRFALIGPAILLVSSVVACADRTTTGLNVQIGSIELVPARLVIDDDKPVQVKAVVKDQDGNAIGRLPSGMSLYWFTGDTSVAVVDQTGRVMPMSAGTTSVNAQLSFTGTQAAAVQGLQAAKGGIPGPPTGSGSVTIQPVPREVAVVSGDGELVKIAEVLPEDLGVRVLDRRGNPIPGMDIDFAIVIGGGTITPSTVTTDAEGLATASWRVGMVAGPAKATATPHKGSVNATFTDSIIPGDPTTLEIAGGDGQIAEAGTALPLPMRVRASDVGGNGIAGITISWSVESGGGSVSPTSSITDASGLAQSTWTLGASAGTQSVSAGASTLTPVTFTATATSDSSGSSDCLIVDPAADTLNYIGDASTLQATTSASGSVSWSSSDPSIASVDGSGKVTARATGVAVITAAVTGCLPAESSVTVRQVVASVSVAPETLSLSTGATAQLSASAADSGGVSVPAARFTWSSSAPEIASVDDNGNVTALSAGTASITAAADAAQASSTVSVSTSSAPPTPPDTISGCPSSGYGRLVRVGTAAELASALSAAQPGDQIRLAAGTYLGATSLDASGTASERIVLCGAAGSWPVLHGGRFTLKGSFVTVAGLVFEGPNASNNNVYITGVHDVLFTGNEVRNGDWHAGIAIEDSYNTSITRNYIHDNGLTDIDHGIYYRHQAGAGNLIANNLIVNNHGRGISMHDNGGAAISDATVVNNTIARNGSTGILVNVNDGTGNVVANNVLADNGWIYDYQQIRVRSGSGNLIANDIVWSPNAGRSGIENSTSSNTVTGNVAEDPLFVSPYTDLHLRTGSPAIGLALASYSPSQDYDGKTRDSAPDAGAYEH